MNDNEGGTKSSKGSEPGAKPSPRRGQPAMAPIDLLKRYEPEGDLGEKQRTNTFSHHRRVKS
jgi:hypothetical protein